MPPLRISCAAEIGAFVLEPNPRHWDRLFRLDVELPTEKLAPDRGLAEWSHCLMDELVRTEAPPINFEINSKLDRERIRREFHSRGRVRVHNFLNHQAADALYHYLDEEVRWRTFVVAGEKLMGAPSEARADLQEQDKEVLAVAYAGARKGFAAAYDATRLFPEDVNTGVDVGEHLPGTVLATCDEFMASEAFLMFARKIVGLEEIKHVATQATRLRTGHFASFHSATFSADKTMKRRAVCFLNLTPEWRPERGGLMGFQQTNTIEAYMPVFNAIDIVAFPQGWWIGAVSSIVSDPIYTVRARLYL